jgi:hypothetical protein
MNSVFFSIKTRTFNVIENLGDIFGDNCYNISFKELQDTLNSQKIYLTKYLPKKFYNELKKALIKDKLVTLPGNSFLNSKEVTIFQKKLKI